MAGFRPNNREPQLTTNLSDYAPLLQLDLTMYFSPNSPRVQYRRQGIFLTVLAALTLLAAFIGVACSRPVSARIGEQFTMGELNYTIKHRDSQGQFVIPLLGQAIDAGRDATFIIVRLEITNNGKTTSAVTLSSFELETSRGTRYRPDVQGTMVRGELDRSEHELPSSDPSGAILRPRIPTPYMVVFRVPYRMATEKLSLIVHEPAFLSGASAVVALQ